MINLSKISLSKYLKLSDEDKEIIDFTISEGLIEREDIIIKKRVYKPISLWNLRYEDVIFIKDNIESDNFLECLKVIYQITQYQIEKASVFNIFSAYQYQIKQLSEMISIENEELNSETDPDENAAGIDMFEKYGFYNEIRSLTGGDKTKENFYKNLPYIEIFMELTYKSNLIKFEKKLNDIKDKK